MDRRLFHTGLVTRFRCRSIYFAELQRRGETDHCRRRGFAGEESAVYDTVRR